MRNIAIIPARGGSKRIPRKNIRLFLGKPIIAYSIEAALSSGLFDEVMVSTDDEEIASIAKEYGAQVPFMRSTDTSNDFSTLADVLLEVIFCYEDSGIKFDNLCCILATAPLIIPEDIKNAYLKLTNSSFTSVYPVIPYSYPIMRSLKMNIDGKISMRWPEYQKVRSQDIETSYHDSGTFYWTTIESIKNVKSILTSNCTGIVIDEIRAQDIDTEVDWKIAELKYELLHE